MRDPSRYAKPLGLLLGLLVSASWMAPTAAAALLTPPPQEYVLRFGGSGQIAIAPLADSLNLGTEFTMEAWVYLEAAPVDVDGVVMGKQHDPPGDPHFSYAIVSARVTGRLIFVQSTGQPGSARDVAAPTDLPRVTWTHVAATLGGGDHAAFHQWG